MNEKNQEIAKNILKQLGGQGRLIAMTGARNFVAVENGLSFRIPTPKGANYFKIVLISKDLYDVEAGRVHGLKYTILATGKGYYGDMLQGFVEKNSGLALSFQKGGAMSPAQRNREERNAKLQANKAELKRLTAMDHTSLANEYQRDYGFPAHHHDRNVVLAALYYKKRIKHLTDEEKDSMKKYAEGGTVGSDLRFVKVTYDDGTVISTSMAAGLTDKDIRDYFKVGRSVNIGSGADDKMAKIEKVDIIFKAGGQLSDAAIEHIASRTGMRPAAVKAFVENNKLDAIKIAQDIGTGNLKPMDFVTAVTGEHGNRYQQRIITGYAAKNMRGGGTIEKETDYYPRVIADMVAFDLLDKELPESEVTEEEFKKSLENLIAYLYKRAEEQYKKSTQFRNAIGKGSEEGRDKFYGFMKHWGEAYIKEHPLEHKKDKGGHIGFDALSKKVAANYEGEPVPVKYQREYGKTYSKEEAREVGDKVAAKVAAIKSKTPSKAQRQAGKIAARYAKGGNVSNLRKDRVVLKPGMKFIFKRSVNREEPILFRIESIDEKFVYLRAFFPQPYKFSQKQVAPLYGPDDFRDEIRNGILVPADDKEIDESQYPWFNKERHDKWKMENKEQ